VLTISSVGRQFPGGVVALQGVNLRVTAGDFVVLLGPSGCGKSTLLRLIAGLDRPDEGCLEWDAGEPVPGDIGFVFQDATLMPWASAARNAELPLRLRGQDTAPARAMLARVGLGGFEDMRPTKLSGGMRMRVSIARALAARPKLLLMDEPFAALDEFTRHGLQDEVLGLAAETGCTVVFVTHSIYEAAFLAQRVVLMSPRPGRVAEVVDYTDRVVDRLGEDFLHRVADLSARAARLAPPRSANGGLGPSREGVPGTTAPAGSRGRAPGLT
jgi:NitT/TauT family transport system ATP-binding protein